MPRLLPRPISEDDLDRAIEAADRNVRLMLVLAGWCGLRAAEIAGLRRSRILRQNKPPGLHVTWTTTKGWRERLVPISSYVNEEMDRYGLPSSGFVITRADGKPMAPWQVSHDCNNHLHSLGIDETLHCGRHRFATQTYEAKRDIRMVQELLGHANPATTAIYTRMNIQDAAAVVEALRRPAQGRLTAA